jgi:hypothetical protein
LNPEGPKDQGGWRFCGRCTSMYFAGDLNKQGVCPHPDGGAHVQVGDHFVLPHA